MLVSKNMSDMTDRYKQDSEDNVKSLVKQNQIATVRYKVYIFFLCLVIFLFWPTFVTTVEAVRGEWAVEFSFTDPLKVFTKEWWWWLIKQSDKITKDIQKTNNEIGKVKIEKRVVELLSDQKKQNRLINCLNVSECEGIDERLLKDIKFLRVFMTMNYLGGNKMSFDQKRLLKNINEFLIRTPGWLENGYLKNISFGGPSVLDKWLKLTKLPIALSIDFDHKRNLITFLENVEEKVYTDLPILYVVESINYDIINYTQRQSINASIAAYYFDDLPPLASAPEEIDTDEEEPADLWEQPPVW